MPLPDTLRQNPFGKKNAFGGGLRLVWLILTSLLASPGMIQVAASCVPSFGKTSEVALRTIGVSAGCLQGCLYSLVLHLLARRLSRRPQAMVGVSTAMMGVVRPCMVVFFLDGGCMAKWTRFFEPCIQS